MTATPTSGALDDDLDAALDRLAATATLLVASDFDGTISDIVERPEDAATVPGATDALEALAALERTAVAVVSGRALDSLVRRPGLPHGVRLIGSHGLEDAASGPLELTAAESARLESVRTLALTHAARVDGCRVEDKPAGVAFHYRSASPAEGLAAVRAYGEALARVPDVAVRSGKAVLEASVRASSKARALQRLRSEVGATLVCFVGDDDTDEEAFAMLGRDDVSVRVGEGRTVAGHRVADPAAVAGLFSRLAAKRRAVVCDRPA